MNQEITVPDPLGLPIPPSDAANSLSWEMDPDERRHGTWTLDCLTDWFRGQPSGGIGRAGSVVDCAVGRYGAECMQKNLPLKDWSENHLTAYVMNGSILYKETRPDGTQSGGGWSSHPPHHITLLLRQVDTYPTGMPLTKHDYLISIKQVRWLIALQKEQMLLGVRHWPAIGEAVRS